MAYRKIGQVLLDLGYLNEDQLELLLSEQKRNRGDQLLGQIAMEMGLLNEDQLKERWRSSWG